MAPKLGTPGFAISLAQGRATVPAFLLYGGTTASPYPIDLSVINMPGCRLYADAAVLQAAVTNTAGGAIVPLPIPNAPVFFGVRLYNQFFLLDPGANGTGVSASNAGRMLIGT